MATTPAITTLRKIKGIDQNEAILIKKALQEDEKILDEDYIFKHFPETDAWIRSCYHPPGEENIARHIVAEIIGFDWQAIEGEDHINHYWQNTIALYLPSQDVYDYTLIYDVEDDRYLVTTYADYYEKNEDRIAE